MLREFLSASVADRILGLSSALVSFSGGVDSSAVVALLAGVMPKGTVHAVLFDSFLHPERERNRAVSMCASLKIDMITIPGPELCDGRVMGNHERRCAFCKELRLDRLSELRDEMKAEVIIDGTNCDDVRDPTRLGNSVLNRFPVFSPLAESGLTKKAVRELARRLDIPWWNESATACMATRFPVGTNLNAMDIGRAVEAEEAVKALGFDVRVRIIGDAICLEFLSDFCGCMLDLNLRESIIKTLKGIGFHRVMIDLEGYRVGRLWP